MMVSSSKATFERMRTFPVQFSCFSCFIAQPSTCSDERDNSSDSRRLHQLANWKPNAQARKAHVLFRVESAVKPCGSDMAFLKDAIELEACVELPT